MYEFSVRRRGNGAEAASITTGFFGLVHRAVGLIEQLLCTDTISGEQADADAYVYDGLEAIQINKHHRQRLLVFGGVVNRLSEQTEEHSAVRQPGQGVVE